MSFINQFPLGIRSLLSLSLLSLQSRKRWGCNSLFLNSDQYKTPTKKKEL
ncbi:hypothetical protein CIPAW_03G095400 [Carya illinoinensis]|uniref:Uncharacterized protein n=1 Tax=Carya illinoinensis TaxID=32201 RepID=A0A8T1QYT9_CARIL|nr:hypothetical protein CIPAW_03G095400 [Carya illinoinensis]